MPYTLQGFARDGQVNKPEILNPDPSLNIFGFETRGKLAHPRDP